MNNIKTNIIQSRDQKYYTANRLALWRKKKDDGREYLGFRVGVFRIMNTRGSVILEVMLPDEKGLLNPAAPFDLIVAYSDGRLDIPNKCEDIILLKNLELKRKWIAKPKPIFYSDNILVVMAEYSCEVEELV